MEINIFKIFIWVGISLDILLEIVFYGSANMLSQNWISYCISDDIFPQMKILNSWIELSPNFKPNF